MVEDDPDATVEADTTPLGVAATSFASHRLIEVNDRRVLLRETPGVWVAPVAFVVLGAGLLGTAVVVFPPPQVAGWVVGGFGVVFLGVGLVGFALGFATRIEFDRDEGVVRFRYVPGFFRSATERPLTNVRAVQLIQGGWHKQGGGAPDMPAKHVFTYQLNLVLADEDESRVNLTNHSNWDATWQTGARLAEFLEVPLLDKASEGDEDEE